MSLPPRRMKAEKDPRQLIYEAQMEAPMQANLIKSLVLFGWDYIYHTKFSVLSKPGMSDVFAARIRDRRVAVIECKREGKQLTDEQLFVLEVLRLIGKVETYALWPSNYDEVIELLR